MLKVEMLGALLIKVQKKISKLILPVLLDTILDILDVLTLKYKLKNWKVETVWELFPGKISACLDNPKVQLKK